jgi:hypothetical protein
MKPKLTNEAIQSNIAYYRNLRKFYLKNFWDCLVAEIKFTIKLFIN